jgi:transcriptional regulator with XRE-family HTH domain
MVAPYVLLRKIYYAPSLIQVPVASSGIAGVTNAWYASCDSGGVAQVTDRLRVARERAGLTIQDISVRTKIRAAALEALERGEFDRLPGDFYVRSFLKAYAREVHLPEEDLLRDYDEIHGAAEPEPVPVPVVRPPAPQPLFHRPNAVVLRWPQGYNTPAALVVTVVLLAVVSFRWAGTSPSANGAAIGTAGVAEAAPAPVGTSGSTAAPDKLVIEIRPAAPIWVAATADGASAIYRLLQPGERVMVEAQKELSFRIGNAGAFVYSINGVPGKPLGAPDEVREFEITRENYQTYRR